MSFKFNKKNISNIIFVVVIAALIYPPSRVWIMRQITFSPSVKAVEKSEKLDTYNWELKGLNTPDVDFNELKGKVIFVNFWATWCPPCKAELPMIQKLVDDYNQKIAFIFVSNENWATINQFFIKYNYNFPVYNAVSAPPQKFSETNSIPATYLIDKKGHILVSKIGAADWNSEKIRNLLDELIAK